MALDDASKRYLAAIAAMTPTDALPAWKLSAEQVRANFSANKPAAEQHPAMLEIQDHELTGADGGQLRLRVLQPTAEPNAVLVYLHGGGWVLNNIDTFMTLGRRLAAASGATVVLVDYRKAPEHPFPAALNDAWAGLNWAADHMAELAVLGAPLIVGGDSAGGNLAAVLAIRSRDYGAPKIDHQLLIYPVTDFDPTRPSYDDPENQAILGKPFMAWFWDQYAPNPEDRLRRDASPMRETDLSGLPSTLLITAEHDVLREEGEAYGERLREAGTQVDAYRWPGQMHGFFSILDVLPASGALLELIATRVRTISNEVIAAAD